MKKPLFSLALSLPICSVAMAQSGPPPHEQNGQAGSSGQPPAARNSKIDEALAACAQSLGASAGQRPDPAKMDACMTAKGFTKPQGGPPGKQDGGKDAPPPPKGDAS